RRPDKFSLMACPSTVGASSGCARRPPGSTRPCSSGIAPCWITSGTGHQPTPPHPWRWSSSKPTCSILQKLPDGLQTSLGEAGGLVSGGEGQRVRLGRGALRTGARLAILDEPFRGLDRERRRTLMDRVRRWWKDATLLCITHDVGETLDFERVIV